MIVCSCRVVSDRAIEEAIAQGARTVGELARSSRAGTACGRCKGSLVEMLDRCTGNCGGCHRNGG